MIPPLQGDSPPIKLINECIQAANEMNMDNLGKYLHKDFQHAIYPQSLRVPALGKEAWLKRMADLGTGYGQTFHSVIDTAREVVIHSTMEIKNPYGLDTNCETVYILRFAPDEDGSLKLKHALAFKDSRVYSELHQALAAAKTSN